MPMNRPGSVSKTSTPKSAATAATKSARGGDRERRCRRPGVDAVEPPDRRDVDELDHRGDHDGRERRLGEVLEQAREEEQRHDRERGDREARDLRLGAGRAVDGRLREAAVHDHAAREAGAEVRGAEAEQLAVHVDCVVVLRGVALRCAEPFGEPDEHDPDRRRGECEVVVCAHVRQAERRQAAVDVTDDLDAVCVEIEHLDRDHAERDRCERRRHHRGEALQAEDEHERRDTDQQCQAARLVELRDETPDLLEEVARALCDAEQLRELPRDDRQREADDEALQHGLGDVAREESEPQQPGDRRCDAGRDRERDRQLREAVAAGSRVRRNGRRRERRGRRHRTDDEMARAAERRVEDQRARRGVEADDGGDAGDRCVRERLGHEHRPHREPGQEIATRATSGCTGRAT